MKMKTHSRGSPKREVYCNTCLPHQTRKVSNTQPNLTSKGATKGARNKAESQQKRNNKD